MMVKFSYSCVNVVVKFSDIPSGNIPNDIK